MKELTVSLPASELKPFGSIIFVDNLHVFALVNNNEEEYRKNASLHQFPVFFTELYLPEKPSFKILKKKV